MHSNNNVRNVPCYIGKCMKSRISLQAFVPKEKILCIQSMKLVRQQTECMNVCECELLPLLMKAILQFFRMSTKECEQNGNNASSPFCQVKQFIVCPFLSFAVFWMSSTFLSIHCTPSMPTFNPSPLIESSESFEQSHYYLFSIQRIFTNRKKLQMDTKLRSKPPEPHSILHEYFCKAIFASRSRSLVLVICTWTKIRVSGNKLVRSHNWVTVFFVNINEKRRW